MTNKFDAAHSDMHLCIDCNHCGINEPCTIDDMPVFREKNFTTDMGCSPPNCTEYPCRLKKAIDRFYSYIGRLSEYSSETSKRLAKDTYAKGKYNITADLDSGLSPEWPNW